jgi:phosphopantetheinyl transferase (holo-ACP synthase)
MARVYSPQEMKFIMSKNFSPYIMSEMYCAKLALKKVMGASFRGCSVQDISVLADYSGTYYISLSGEAKKRFPPKMHTSVSCSHTRIVTMAVVSLYE